MARQLQQLNEIPDDGPRYRVIPARIRMLTFNSDIQARISLILKIRLTMHHLGLVPGFSSA